MFINDDFHHNGAFRLSYGFEYSALLETSKEKNTDFEFDQYDTYSWYLTWARCRTPTPSYFHGKLPTWNDFVEHPNHDFWKQHAVTDVSEAHDRTEPECCRDGTTRKTSSARRASTPRWSRPTAEHLNYFVAGPWNHGGWMGESGRKLGDIDWGSDICALLSRAHFRAVVRALAARQAAESAGGDHLRNRDQRVEELRRMAAEEGRDREEALPSRERQSSRSMRPREQDAFDTYISDPANPVPYRHRPVDADLSRADVDARGWSQDQRFVEHRPDVLTWQTDPLKENITVTGDIVADLFASTTAATATGW